MPKVYLSTYVIRLKGIFLSAVQIAIRKPVIL